MFDVKGFEPGVHRGVPLWPEGDTRGELPL